jgi:hypothetical protein
LIASSGVMLILNATCCWWASRIWTTGVKTSQLSDDRGVGVESEGVVVPDALEGLAAVVGEGREVALGVEEMATEVPVAHAVRPSARLTKMMT